MIQQSQRASRSAESRFFAYVQSIPWYRQLLMAVVTALADLAPGSRVLDVGTGPGHLLAMLHHTLALDGVGVDADLSMLAEARRLPALAEVPLIHVPAGDALPFPRHSFDAVCFCSVLYLMQTDAVEVLLKQAARLLRPHGRIVILTPSGEGRPHMPDGGFHWTFFLWRRLTSAMGGQWHAERIALSFAERQGMGYARHAVFSGMATVEVITTQ
jgi:SAM-dependent methyltransferase